MKFLQLVGRSWYLMLLKICVGMVAEELQKVSCWLCRMRHVLCCSICVILYSREHMSEITSCIFFFLPL